MTKSHTKMLEKRVLRDRNSGMSLREIASKYEEDGITMYMVRKICNTVSKPKSETTEAAEKILPLAMRSEGVKPSEYHDILKECFGVEWCEKEERVRLSCTPQQRSYVRRRVKEMAEKIGSVAIFVPEWMDKERPKSSLDEIYMCATALHDCLEEQVSNFIREFPEMEYAGYSIREEILSLAVSGYDKGGADARCSRNLETVELLELGGKNAKKLMQDLDSSAFEEDVTLAGY